MFFFFKQKTAYEMRISDWSSDVCSSDLWSEMIFNHITLKVPGEDGAFLINPFGLHFSEVTASNLVKIDIDGNKLDGSPFPVNLAGFTQHAVFHRNLPAAHCIMQTHTTAGQAGSSFEGRSEKRRVGKDRVGTCRSRWRP